MQGARPDEPQVEDLRRALYRPGSDGADVRLYLAARRSGPAPSPEPAPVRRTHRPRPWWRVVAGAVVLVVLLAWPALPGRAPLYRLPAPAAGEFSAPFPVAGSAADGTRSLWSALRGTETFTAAHGAEVASALGEDRVFTAVAQPPVSAAGKDPLTLFVACSGGSADVLLIVITEDFDQGYQVPFASVRVPCSGVQAVRYTRPAGVVPDAVSVVTDGRVAVSVVAGL